MFSKSTILGTSQARASLEITWPIMRKHRFDSSQSDGFVAFSCSEAGAWVDSWLVSSPENSS